MARQDKTGSPGPTSPSHRRRRKPVRGENTCTDSRCRRWMAIVTVVDGDSTPWLAYLETLTNPERRVALRFDSPTRSVRVPTPPDRALELPNDALVELLKRGQTLQAPGSHSPAADRTA